MVPAREPGWQNSRLKSANALTTPLLPPPRRAVREEPLESPHRRRSRTSRLPAPRRRELIYYNTPPRARSLLRGGHFQVFGSAGRESSSTRLYYNLPASVPDRP